MATYPHIRLVTASSSAQGFYLSQGKSVPQEVYQARIAADTIDTNQQFWIQKDTGGALQRVRIDYVELLDLPAFAATAALDIDAGRGHQKLRLYTGNAVGTATAVEQDTTSQRRWTVMFSLG